MKKRILLIIPILVFVLGVSYAFYEYSRVGESNNEIVAGQIYMNYTDSNTLYLTNIFPETKEEALKEGRTDNEIRFSIKGKNEYTKKDIYYEINLNLGDEIEGKKRIRPEDVMIYLECDGEVLIDGVNYEDWNEKRIWVHTIPANTLEETTKNYLLKAWVRDDILISDSNPNADYTADDWNLSYISLKLSVYGDFVEKEMPLSNVLSERIETTIDLTEADVDGTRFVYGETVDNNYVWYSGKLWRIVAINSDGSIKLVTQGNMTTITWDISSTNIDYSTSQMRTWLNNEFLPTLYNADNLLVDHEWDYTTYEEFPTTKLITTSTVTEKVGLINIYEYMMTGGTASSSTSKTFLNNGYNWWMISSENYWGVWRVSNSGYAAGDDWYRAYGARPSVNMKSEITILGGTGEKGNPYTLEGDKVIEKTTELLSNRISGEYINFNNTKYRIVGIETINGQQLTKVTMADYSINNNTLTTPIAFDESDETIYNTSAGIGKYMNEWYNGTSIDSTYKAMIATDGIEWYTGPDSGTRYDYTLSKSGTTVETPIGLPYYGEMFSSQFGEGYRLSTETWLITKPSGHNVWSVFANGAAYDLRGPSYSGGGARPSFYLKSDVKIISGSGMPNNPYELADIPPACTIFGDTDMMVGSTYTYNIKCIDMSGFNDSDITISDITISNSSVLSISTPVKSTITNGYKYALTVTPKASGTTTISLKAGSVSDANGNTNNTVTSTTITITKDTTAPVCTITGDTDMTIGKTYTYNIECTDAYGFSDSEITTSDFEFSTAGILEISDISASSITGGNKYNITVNALSEGTTTLTLKSGVVSDNSGNTNVSVTSNSITVRNSDVDYSPPVCEFSGPAVSRIYVSNAPQSTEFYLTCTDESEFSDSDITIDDFTVSDPSSLVDPVAAPGSGDSGTTSEPAISVSSVTKTAITGGYKYTITVNALMVGSNALTLNAGVISDKYGYLNTEVVSDTIYVSYMNMS